MTGKLRVLFAIGSLSGGGSERQMVQILRALDRSRFQPFLYLIDRQGEFLHEVPEDVPVRAFWEEHRRPWLNWPGRIHQWQVRHLTQVLREFAIDLLYDRTLPMALVTARAARRADVPHVPTIVSDPVRDFATSAGRFRPIKRWLLRQAYQSAARVVAVSEGIREAAVRQYGLPPARVVTLPNLYDFERIRRLADEPLEPFPEGRFHVLFAGRLQPEKGADVFVQAAELLIRVRGRENLLFHVLGTGALEAELKQFVGRCRFPGSIVFHEFRSNPYPYFRQAHVFCLPSRYEGFPNALVEAMACGTPVIASDCPSGPREILADGKFGELVVPGDPVALADAIERVESHYAQALQTAETARQYVEKNYGVESGIEKL
ncbi:MAG: glycosyltransferase, partial [Planctomycetes bacterium]|nr:glycosyltransferase [Planctomycetota bacterium]